MARCEPILLSLTPFFQFPVPIYPQGQAARLCPPRDRTFLSPLMFFLQRGLFDFSRTGTTSTGGLARSTACQTHSSKGRHEIQTCVILPKPFFDQGTVSSTDRPEASGKRDTQRRPRVTVLWAPAGPGFPTHLSQESTKESMTGADTKLPPL